MNNQLEIEIFFQYLSFSDTSQVKTGPGTRESARITGPDRIPGSPPKFDENVLMLYRLYLPSFIKIDPLV